MEVTGGKVKGGAGYGLEVLCVYEPRAYTDRMKEIIPSYVAELGSGGPFRGGPLN